MSSGLDMLGAEPASLQHSFSWSRGTIALVAGALGAFVFRRSHPVLAFLDFSALASNTHAVVAKERSWQDAGRRMGRHLIATAGSLAMPKHGLIGYLAGAVGADMLIDGEGGGVIEEWARYTGVGGSGDVIDAEIVEEKPPAAMVAYRPRPHSSTWTVDGGGPPGHFPGGK
jgi:hypothetical protein